jgi:transcriptional regulator with XRE-family HTH domain
MSSTGVDQKIAALIKRRRDLGITQRALDDMVGVSDCMIAKWESGQRSPTALSLEKWANALGLKLALVVAGKQKREKAS